MKITELLSRKYSEKKTLGMILSNRADMGSSDGALISMKAYDGLIDDLMLWKEQPPPINTAMVPPLKEIQDAFGFVDRPAIQFTYDYIVAWFQQHQ